MRLSVLVSYIRNLFHHHGHAPVLCQKKKEGSPGIPVVTGENSVSTHAKSLGILGRSSNDILFSREFRES